MDGTNALTESAGSDAAEAANEAEEQVTGTTDAEAGEHSEDEAGEKPERKFTQAELDKILARQHNRAQRRYEKQLGTLQTQLEEVRKEQKAAGEKATAGATTAKPPSREDYESYEDYIGAKARFEAGEEIRKEVAELKKGQEKQETSRKEADAQAKLAKDVQARVSAGRKEFPDFDIVTQEVIDDELVVPGTELYFGIIDSEVGHRIIMHLAKNPELAEKINKMSPRGIHRELGKLEDKLSKAPEKKTAAEVMEPLNGRGGKPTKLSDPNRDDISMDDYVRLKNAQDDKRRKGL